MARQQLGTTPTRSEDAARKGDLPAGGAAGPVETCRRVYTGELPVSPYTPTIIPLSSTDYNDGAAFSVVSETNTPINGIRCLKAGVLDLSADTRFIGGSTAAHNVGVRVNNDTIRQTGVTASGNVRCPVASTIRVNAGDIVTVMVYVETGDVSLFADGPDSIALALTYLGPRF